MNNEEWLLSPLSESRRLDSSRGVPDLPGEGFYASGYLTSFLDFFCEQLFLYSKFCRNKIELS